MKKALAIVMALVIALSMSAMAFAADAKIACGFCKSEGFANAAELREHIATYHPVTEATEAPATFRNDCPICGREFADEDAYNDHIAICKADKNSLITDLTVKELLTMLIDLVKINAGQWDAIESVIIRLVDFIENMGKGLVSAADVNGAVADLEASLAGLEIPGADDILNQIKAKIKAMYAGEKATTVVTETETTTEESTTEAEVIVDTGSASAGIAAFAAVSVAAAAAYVCTKKKA